MRRLSMLLVLLAALCCGQLRAQSTSASVTGYITDPTKAVIVGAKIIVINVDTNLRYEAATNGDGSYDVRDLPPGRYRIEVEKPGFKTVVKSDVTLHVQDTAAINFEMALGSASEIITVEGGAPLIDTTRTSVSTVVDRQFVENIALNGRSFQSLITLTPGVVIVPSDANNNGQFSVNGQRSSANNFTVDGVSANSGAQPGGFGAAQSSGNLPGLTTFGTTQSLVSVDALQEFKVQTSTYAAEYGRQPGGQISIVTRSGTNQFHGSAFDYLRNDIFDANDWFADRAGQPKPPERQNDFGGTLGGPIIIPALYNGRDHTFFFFSYEGLRLQLPQFSLSNVPTVALRRQAPAGMWPILNAFPLPNGRDLGNGLAEFGRSYSDPSTLNAASIRIDHSSSKYLTLFARYNYAPSQSLTRAQFQNLAMQRLNRLTMQTLTAGVTSSLTPSMTNELRFNYTSNGSFFATPKDTFGGAAPPPRSALIPSQFDSRSAQAVIFFSFPGATTGPALLLETGTQVSSQRQFNVVESFSYTRGSHRFKFGFDYRHSSPIEGFDNYLLQAFFTSQQQVLAASAGSGSVTANINRNPTFLNFSAYAQDTWLVARRLTLDLGLRWDINPPPSTDDGRYPAAIDQINNLATMQLAPLGTKGWKTTYNNLAPRLGIAYRLFHAPGHDTVLRGGFGIFYDTGNEFGALGFNINQAFPYSSSRTISNIIFPLSPTQLAPSPLPVDTGLMSPYPLVTAFDPSLKLPYTWQWNLSVAQSLGTRQAITLSYVGAAGRRLLQATQFNLSNVNPRFTTVRLTRNTATSDYDSLQTQFQRDLSKGLQALVSYTWSHALDNDSTGNSLRVAQRGNAAFDIRHVFAAAATYEIPSPYRARRLIGGWSIDTSAHAQTGQPVDLVSSILVDPATGSNISVRPDVIAGVPFYVDDPSVPGGRRVNRAAFTIPTAGQSGNLGRNQVRGLGAWQVDSAVRKQFNLTEKVRLQFRAESFNLFNHPNFGRIQTTLNAANFGQATNMLNRQLGGISQLYQIGGPRSFQFALKLLF